MFDEQPAPEDLCIECQQVWRPQIAALTAERDVLQKELSNAAWQREQAITATLQQKEVIDALKAELQERKDAEDRVINTRDTICENSPTCPHCLRRMVRSVCAKRDALEAENERLIAHVSELKKMVDDTICDDCTRYPVDEGGVKSLQAENAALREKLKEGK